MNTPKIILCIETSTAYGRGILKGIAKYSRLQGPWNFFSEPGDVKSALPKFKSWKADGIIAHVSDRRKIEELKKTGIPFIIKGQNQITPDQNVIVSDCQSIGKMGAEYFLAKGFRHFAFVGYKKCAWSQNRETAFKDSVNAAGFDVLTFRINEDLSWEKEQNAIAEWLKPLSKPIAIMACNDMCARHIVEACRLAEFAVPLEAAVLGVDNDEVFCELSNPALSSIQLDTETVGYKTAELLSQIMSGKTKKSNHVLVKPLYVVSRQSTDTLAVSDAVVAKALNYIYQNARQNLAVNDVVAATDVSRTVLQQRFRQAMGFPIYKEITRIRTDHMSRMLLETEMSINEIVRNMNFDDAKHASRYFRRQKKMSMAEYRRLFKK